MPQLGHAEHYEAALHLQGGGRLWTRIPRLREVSWGRVRDDYSDGSASIAKEDVSGECAGLLGMARSWGHELTVYRDGEFMWQGPITQKSEFPARFEVEARDVAGWLDRRRNTRPYNWQEKDPEQNPDAWGPAPVGNILRTVLTDTFAEHDPGVLAYTTVASNSTLATLQAMQTRVENVGDLVRSLLDYGMDMFTIGRALYFVNEADARAVPPIQLTEYDFPSELEVREVGVDLATRGVIVGSKPQNPVDPATGTQQVSNKAKPVGVYPAPPAGVDDFFGLVERGETNQSATDEARATWLAEQMVRHNFPPPVSLIVPSSAQLAPTAPVSIHDLFPTRPVQVSLLSYHTPVTQRFQINEVDVQASISSGAMSEQVSVSLDSGGSQEGVLP